MNNFTTSIRRSLYILLASISINCFSQDFNTQHIESNIGRNGGTATITAVSSTNNAFVLINNNRKNTAGRSNQASTNHSGRDLSGAVRLTGNNTLTYYRNSSSLNSNTKFNSTVWEYTGASGGVNEFIVRGRYTINLNGTTNNITQAISGISNANKCIPFITGIISSAGYAGSDSSSVIAYLEDSSNLRIQKGSNSDNITVYITLVEFTGSNWTVLHGDSGGVNADSGTITLRNNSDGTGSITNVSDWNESFIITHSRGNMNNNGVDEAIADNWPLVSTGSNNQVSWTFNANHDGTANGDRHFVHVLNNPDITVNRFTNNSNSAGEVTINITSAGLTDVNQALIIGTSTSSGTGAAYARGWRNYYLNSTTQAAHWCHRSGNTMSHEIQIIDLSTPSYCNASGSALFNTGSTNVTFNTIDNTSTSDNAYQDFTNLSTTVNQGSNYNLTISVDTDGGYRVHTKVWIDWNQDLDFDDANEEYDFGDTNVDGIIGTVNVNIPATATIGSTRMRVATRYNQDPTSCLSVYDGEVEDYTVIVNSGAPAPEINITGLGNTILDENATPLTTNNTNFGDVGVGSNKTHSFVIQNTGNQDLTIGTITFSGANPGDFAVISTPTTTITAGNSSTFDVQFTPSSLGIKTATISIANNDSDENPYNFLLEGNGADPYCASSGNSSFQTGTTRVIFNTIDNVDTDNTDNPYEDFTAISTTVDQNNIYQLTTRVNTDGNYTVYTKVWIDWNQDNDFLDAGEEYDLGNATNVTNGITSLSPLSITIPATATIGATRMRVSTKFDVSPTSCETGFDGEVEDYTVVVQSGTPVPEINITGLTNTILDGDNTPSTIDNTDYGNVNTGSNSTNSFVIQNIGTADLIINSISFTGTNAADFSIATALPITISQGSNASIDVVFSPTTVGLKTATIQINNNDSDENPYNFDLQGNGFTPQSEINITGLGNTINNGDATPTTIDNTDFGTVNVGNSDVHTFTIENSGTLDLTIGAITFSGANAADFSLVAAPSSIITSGSTGTFNVQFTPSAAGNRTAIISIVNNDNNENPYTFTIQGNGFIPTPEINITGLGNTITDGDTTPNVSDDTEFGNVSTGSFIDHTFTIQNLGTAALNLTGSPLVAISGNAAFTVITQPSASVIASGSSVLTFTIRFTPTTTNTVQADISIANNDSNENPYNFRVSGTGIIGSPEINITGLGNTISDGETNTNTTDNTDFGTVSVSYSLPHTFTIENTGNGILSLGGITFSGANAGDFIISSNPNTTVPIGGTTTFEIQFTPSAIGIRTATISIANNDTDENPYNFNLSGEGIQGTPKYTAYYENFDRNNGGWTSVTSSNDNWLWTNTYPASITDEIAEGGFWRNNNYNTYSNNTNIVIQSPAIDFSNLQNIRFSIDVSYLTENNYDGMRILYSTGGAYTELGSSGEGINWYDDNTGVFSADAWNGDSHSTVPSFSPYSRFKRATINLDDATFAGQSNVIFRIQFSSDGGVTDRGVAFDNIKIEADPNTPLANPSQAPANVSNNLRLWLKANSGISTTDGTALTNWEDQAFVNNLDKEDATSATALAPIFRDNTTRNLNYNPVLDFDHNVTQYMNGKGGFFSHDYFVVIKSDDQVDTQTGSFSPGRQFAIGGRFSSSSFHEDPTGLSVGSSSARFDDEIIAHNVDSFPNSGDSEPDEDSYGRAYSSRTDSFNHVLILNVKTNQTNTASEIYKNGKRFDNVTGVAGNGAELNFTNFNNLTYLVGTGHSGITGRTTSQLNGRLTEIISYESPTPLISKRKVQSYLALKYGVTLQDEGSALTDYRQNDVDYIDSNGDVFWDTSANSGYNFDVAGIGRDDNSQLLQKQSRSQNEEVDGIGPTSGFLTISLTDTYDTNNLNISNNTTSFNDREFLVWGNNNASLNGAATNVTVDMSEDIGDISLQTNVSFTGIPRIWKVVEVGGDIPKVEVSIPKSIVRTAAPPDGRYLMFISASGVFDPTADYRVMKEVGDYLYTDYDFDGTEYITFGWAPERTFERSIYFSPANNDYIDIEDHLNLNPSGFTVSAWVKRDATATGTTSVISKRNVAFSNGFDFRILNDNTIEMIWKNGTTQSLISNTELPADEWHQIAAIYDGTELSLYIDGVQDKAANKSAPSNTNESFFIGAAGKNTPLQFFRGNIDEVRVWETNLSVDQLRYIMNQEIADNSNFVAGKYFESLGITVTKNEVATIPWSSLAGYYPMSTYTYTNTKDESGNGRQGALKNLKTVDWQTAPLPYKSTQHGDWNVSTTWENGNVQTIPGTKSIVDNTVSVDWNIVETNHNILFGSNSDLPTDNLNRSLLGLFVDSNKITLDGDNAAETGFGLTVTHYLNLDGEIDLNGESQLIQTEDSDLNVTSSGQLEKDQQGTRDLYTYDYWAAPVGTTSTTQNNTSYTLPTVLKNGTDPDNPAAITFLTSGYNGATSGSDISIADYWVWKFNNQQDDDYASWQHVRSTGTINAGEGYTMKGVFNTNGNVTQEQNYVFKGKPNNSDINLTLNSGNDYLVGNPYPSAIDAIQFIRDNGPELDYDGTDNETDASISGTLYFWDHWGGGSHNLQDYQGGYATYNYSGAVAAASYGTNDPDVGTGGTPIYLPGRYIPVGKGFFVVGENDGQINFNNGQRVFAINSTATKTNASTTQQADNNDSRMKIRLGFDSVGTIHRQLLVTVDENATLDVDFGFEAIANEDQMDDMFWKINDENYMIQGIGEVTESTILPLYVKTATEGTNTIKIDALSNVAEDLMIYVHDKELELYHNLRESNYEVYLNSGEFTDRFEITFQPGEQLSITEFNENVFDVHYTNSIESIVIMNPELKDIKTLELYNILGQSVYKNTNVDTESYSEYKVDNLSSGTYIIKIKTNANETISKKVLVK